MEGTGQFPTVGFEIWWLYQLTWRFVSPSLQGFQPSQHDHRFLVAKMVVIVTNYKLG